MKAVMPTFRSPIAKFTQAMILVSLLLCIFTNGPFEFQTAQAAVPDADAKKQPQYAPDQSGLFISIEF